MGPKFVVIKKGEHGAMFFSEHEIYVLPAYPTPDVVDPTGAGDSFAGGMMGYLAERGELRAEDAEGGHGLRRRGGQLHRAKISASTGSRNSPRDEIESRLRQYARMLSF